MATGPAFSKGVDDATVDAYRKDVDRAHAGIYARNNRQSSGRAMFDPVSWNRMVGLKGQVP